MVAIPRDGRGDHTLSLLIEGYEFVPRRCARLGSDVFETRLLLEPTVCMRGRDAAELFYEEGRFRRSGATPAALQKTLFGEGGVQGLDDQPHRHRKRMLMALMTPDRIRDLAGLVADRWHDHLSAWERNRHVVLYDVCARILAEAVHTWAGVPLRGADVERHVHDLHGMIVGGTSIGPGYLWGRVSRRRAERRLAQLVEDVRARTVRPAEDTALHAVAFHLDLDGQRLDARIAAVELLNVLRPTVAIDRFITFAALALHEHPQWAERVRGGDRELARRFVQEVRRHYPFFPFVVARARTGFEWHGYWLPQDRHVLLDLYGSNHDPRVWDEPARFAPERFEDAAPSPFAPIPQGGGDFVTNHRCAGEWVTIEVMTTAVELLTRSMTYTVPEQDLRIPRGRIPALPRSGLVISDVRRAG